MTKVVDEMSRSFDGSGFTAVVGPVSTSVGSAGVSLTVEGEEKGSSRVCLISSPWVRGCPLVACLVSGCCLQIRTLTMPSLTNLHTNRVR